MFGFLEEEKSKWEAVLTGVTSDSSVLSDAVTH